VDLISYTITALGRHPKFKEAAPGAGGLCGGIFLNRAFAKFLRESFSGHQRWSEEVFESAMQHFEREKKTFGNDPDGRLIIPLYLDNGPWIVNGRLIMSSTDVARIIFDPVVNEVIKLVQSQIEATRRYGTSVQAVLLVGGFGQNTYLHRRLDNELGSGVRVIPGHNG
jgi:hypothetical protein